MSLQADRPFPEFAALAGVVTERPIINPVDHLEAVDPRGEVVSPSDHGHGEPLVVFGDLKAGGYTAVNRAGTVVDSRVLHLVLGNQLVIGGIVFFNRIFLAGRIREAIVDLGFVAVLIFLGPAAEKDAAVKPI